nr:helix-turn-helix domain-containing protein [Pandoraea communis]
MKLDQWLKASDTSQSALARMLGVSPGLIYQWLSGLRPVAPEHCPAIERISDSAVRCEELNDRVDWAYLRANPDPGHPHLPNLQPGPPAENVATASDPGAIT